MNTLYNYDQNEYNGTTFQNAAEEAITFSKEVLTKMLKDIYDGMNVQDDIHRDAFYETLRIFNEASAEGISQVSRLPSHMGTFLEQLKTNNEVFSAFRVHRMQNDMAKLMIGNDGQLKSFEEWKKDIKGISDHYVDRWLKTEYSTAVLRAHQAADWIRFREETDVYPNLRWMPTTSPEPDQYHKQYWSAKLTLPVNHPFWKSHRPGDRWNCKCSLRQTDEPATTSLVADFKPIPAEPGLENNPADDGKLFNDTHPYITHAHEGAKEAVKTELMQLRRLEIKQEAQNLVDKPMNNFHFNKAIFITRKGIKEWLNQPHVHYIEKNEMLLNIPEVIREAKYVGCGPDKHNESITAHVFETELAGDKTWLIVREFPDGTVRLHSISDSIKILDLIKKAK